MKIFSHEQVIRALRRKQGSMSLRRFAQELGISPAYLSDVYNGNRQPGCKLLSVIGMQKESKRTVTYFET